MTTLINTTETDNHLTESFQPSQNRVCFDNFENTRVSLIIPAYNACESIAELLEKSIGVLKGLRRACEIIVVDDGSSDRTLEVIKGKEVKIIATIQHWQRCRH